MEFDPTFSVGSVLNLIGFVIGGIIFAVTLRGDLRALVARVTKLENHTGAIEGALTTLAVQSERLTSHARRIEKLETKVDGK